MEEFTVLLDKKRKYKGSLPCPQCGTSLLHNCIKNGVKYIQGHQGKPEKIWNADLYKCPACKNLVLTDFGRVSEWNRTSVPAEMNLQKGLQELIDAWVERNERAESIPVEQRAGYRIIIIYSWQFDQDGKGMIYLIPVAAGRAA